MKTGLLILILSSFGYSQNIAIKNYHEIYSSLAVSTNIAPDEKLDAKFKSISEILPKFGNVDEYNSAMQLAHLQLAAEFCQKRVTLDSALEPKQRWLHREIDFKKSPKDFTVVEKTSLISEYADVFWQRSPSEKEVALSVTAFEAFATEGLSTVDSLVFECTIAATSVGALTI